MCERKETLELIAKYIKELAEIIHLRTGGVRITISESRAVKIEARTYSRVCCQRRRANEWETLDEEVTLVLDLAPQYVTNRLESLIVEWVGQFGHLEGVLDDHEVTNLIFNISLAPPNRSGSSKHRYELEEIEGPR